MRYEGSKTDEAENNRMQGCERIRVNQALLVQENEDEAAREKEMEPKK